VARKAKGQRKRRGQFFIPGRLSDATAQLFDLDDPTRPVMAFLQEDQTLFGFGPEALDDANVQRDYVSAGNGARTVVWQQQVAGLPVRNHSGLVAWSRSQSKSGSSDATDMKLYFLVATPDCCGN
jgi:hypothetical protein